MAHKKQDTGLHMHDTYAQISGEGYRKTPFAVSSQLKGFRKAHIIQNAAGRKRVVASIACRVRRRRWKPRTLQPCVEG
jgi:hypothetical protein